jgi:hypothetical protein
MKTGELPMNTFPSADQEDLIELSKQGCFAMLLDENLRGLEMGLEDNGFKVIVLPQGLADDVFKRKARGWAILTRPIKSVASCTSSACVI